MAAQEPLPSLEFETSWQARALKAWRLLVAVVARFRGEALALRAGNLTFITMTSLVPMVAVLFSLLHTFAAKRIDPLVIKFFEDILSPGGKTQSQEILRTLLSAANSKTGSGLSFVALLVSAGLMLRHLDASLNDIWQVQRKRPVMTSLGLYSGVLLAGPLLAGASLLGSQEFKHFIGWLEFPFSSQLYFVGAVLSGMTVFTLLYKLAPHAPVPWKSAVSGGVVAGLSWEIARHVYGSIAIFFLSQNKVYGSLGIAPLFLMWVYVGWYIVLAGARFAYAVEHADFETELHQSAAHPRSNEVMASHLAREVTSAWLTKANPPTVKELSLALKIPQQRVSELAGMMLRAGLLGRGEKGGLFPMKSPEVLTLEDVSKAVGGTAHLPMPDVQRLDGVAKVFQAADAATVDALKRISWKDLAESKA